MAKNLENEVDDDLDEDKKPKNGEGDDEDALKKASKAEGDHEDDDKDEDADEKSPLEKAAEAEEQAEAVGKQELSPEELEKRRERKRAERKARKQAARERQEAQQRENAELKRRLKALEDGQQHIHRRTTGHEIGQLDRAMEEIKSTYHQAKAKRKAAMEAGDAEGFENADEVIRKCELGYARLGDVKKRLQAQAQNQGRTSNPSAAKLGAAWLEKNSWYQVDGDGEDTEIARVIDERLANEGVYDPGTPEYWAELDRRLAKRLPHRYKKAAADDQDDDDDDQDEEAIQVRQHERRPNRGGPPTGGNGRDTGTGGGGGRQEMISAKRVQALKDAGMWDDPKKRAKMIKKYQEQDRLMAAERS